MLIFSLISIWKRSVDLMCVGKSENGRVRRFLFVTARERDVDELCAMECGGDDYIRKPYSLAILLAKVKRMLQRADSMAEEIVVGEVHLHIVQAQICYREQVLELSKMS